MHQSPTPSFVLLGPSNVHVSSQYCIRIRNSIQNFHASDGEYLNILVLFDIQFVQARLQTKTKIKSLECSEKYFTAELIGDLNLNINTNWCNFSCHKFIHQFIYFYKHQFTCVWHILSVQYALSNIINDF